MTFNVFKLHLQFFRAITREFNTATKRKEKTKSNSETIFILYFIRPKKKGKKEEKETPRDSYDHLRQNPDR